MVFLSRGTILLPKLRRERSGAALASCHPGCHWPRLRRSADNTVTTIHSRRRPSQSGLSLRSDGVNARCARLVRAGQLGLVLPCHSNDELRRWRRYSLAVLAIDLVGYSRMVESDVLRAAMCVTLLRRKLIRPIVARYSGRIFSIASDGLMAAFPLVAAAIDAAVAIQRAVEGCAGRGTLVEARLRMGISFGPVLETGGQYFGHALNVAARLEALSPPGSVYLCGSAFDAIAGGAPAPLVALGEKFLAKMSSACRVYAIDLASRRLDRGEVELDHG